MNTPTFTPDPPTKPGWYLWKRSTDAIPQPIEVYFSKRTGGPKDGELGIIGPESKLFRPIAELNCLWCRLVPAEEVERAWREAQHEHGLPNDVLFYRWGNSRAKRVMEGEV